MNIKKLASRCVCCFIAFGFGSPVFAASPAPLATPAPSDQGRNLTVLGFREPNGQSITEVIAELRRALAMQLGASHEFHVRSDNEVRARLGLPPMSASSIVNRIHDAESSYQQYALDIARSKFEAALQDLPAVGGEKSTWDSAKTAHLLLAMIYLSGQGNSAPSKAKNELEAILRLDSNFHSSEAPDDPQIRQLLEKARAKVRSDPTGMLKVECNPACRDGFVWVDAAPAERVDRSPFRLPVGTYRVRVTDRVDNSQVRSFSHEVTIREGAETQLTVDLEAEGTIDAMGGPSFVVPPDGDSRNRALRAAARANKSGQIALIWFEGTGASKELHLAVADGSSGKVERRAYTTLPQDGRFEAACENLAMYLISGKPGKDVTKVDPDLSPVKQSGPSNWSKVVSPAAWTATGSAIALGVSGLIVTIDQNKGSGPDRPHTGTGLLIGAGGSAIAAIVLHIIDWQLNKPSPTELPDTPNAPNMPNSPSAPKMPNAPDSPKLPSGPKAPSAPKVPSFSIQPAGIGFSF